MIAIIILMIVALTLGGIAAYQLYGITQNQNLLIQAQKNQSTLALWKSMLVSKAKAVGENNEIVLPLGENTLNYHKVPSWVYFNTKNPWGKDIIYCPFSVTSTGTLDTNIQISETESYQVRTASNFATISDGLQRDYVVASTPNTIRNDILAYLISPTPSTIGEYPKCSDVTYDNDLSVFKVQNGLVDVIMKGDLETFRNLSSVRDQLAGNGAFYSNVVQGEGSTNGNTLMNNINYLVGQDIAKAYIKLDIGTHYLESTALNEFRTENNDNKKVLIIEGGSNNYGDTIVRGFDSNVNLKLNNYKVTFRNITISGNVINDLKDSDITLENVQISNLILENSNLTVNKDSRVIGTYAVTTDMLSTSKEAHAINLYNSKMYVKKGINFLVFETQNSNRKSYAIRAEGSKIKVNGSLVIYKRNKKDTNETISNHSVVLLNSEMILNSEIRELTLPPTLIFSMILPDYNEKYISDILIDENSFMYLNNGSVVTLSGYSSFGIYNNGKLKINGGTIYPAYNQTDNATITMGQGSELYMNSNSTDGLYSSVTNIGTASNRTQYGILDNGAKFIGGGSGNDVNVYALTAKENCFLPFVSESVFKYSETNQNQGTTSKIIDTPEAIEALRYNRSNWQCNF